MSEIEILRKKNIDLIERSKKKISELTQRIDELENEEKNIELYQAIAGFKREMMLKKNGVMKYGNKIHKFFTLEDVLSEVDRLFPKYDLLLLQPPSSDATTIEVQVIHTPTGQKTKPSRLKIIPTANNERVKAQGGGITYARRYLLTSFFGIAAEEDTDGN